MVSIVSTLNLALGLFFLQLAAAAELTCEQDGIHGNPDNCLKFIICAHGQRQDFDCPQGTSWHADRGICDTTDLSKCTAIGTGTSGSEDVFKQHLLSLLADFKPCHAGETTLAPGVTTENPGQGGNGTTAGNGGGSPATGPTTAGPGETTPGNPGGNGGSTTGNPGGNPGSSPSPDGGNTTPGNGGGSSTGNPGGNPTTPNPGQGGNGSTPNPGDGGSTPQPTTVAPPTCPACPIPTEKPCPVAEACPACPTHAPQSCPAAPTCPPPAPAPTCKACPAPRACPAVATCPSAPQCATCPKPTEKVCPTAAPCPTTPAKPICDAGWKYFAATESCYFLSSDKVAGTDAQVECMKRGANLISVHSEEENKFIFDWALTTTTASFVNLWVGLYRTGSGINAFANYDGTPFDFKKWWKGNPDNAKGVEFCVEMLVVTNDDPRLSQWNDGVCSGVPRPYMCKKPANTATSDTVIHTTTKALPTTTSTPKPVPTTQCTGEWSEWSNAPGASCNDTCGNCGLVNQQRTCLPAGCKCTGESTAVNPCGSAVCAFPRATCCAPYTKKSVNGAFVCA